MYISVVTGIGQGKTELSAFDSALSAAGIYNYNLIPLSSIIPPRSKVVKTRKYRTPDSEYGHKLYVIKADIRSKNIGEHIAAGLGWYQFEDGRGVFVEHEVRELNQRAVLEATKQRILDSLRDLCTFRHVRYNAQKANMDIATVVVKESPVCALSIAVYKAEGWE